MQLLYSGVCRTDYDFAMGKKGPSPQPEFPFVGGHESTGLVVACGSRVHHLEVGDPIGTSVISRSCLVCSSCRHGDEPFCSQFRMAGFQLPGTFQQYAVAQAAHVIRLPVGCDLAQVTPVFCAGITAYCALRRSDVRPGQFVTIVGAGGALGHLALQYARAMGMRAIAIDVGSEKRDLCLRFGAVAYVDFLTSEDVVAEAKAATPDGLGSHALIVLGSNESAYSRVIQHVRSGGVIVCVGFPQDDLVSLPVIEMALSSICVKGSFLGGRDDLVEAIDFAQRGLVKPEIHVSGLSELQDIFQRFRDNKVSGRYVLDMSR